jgi:hypothetical protein
VAKQIWKEQQALERRKGSVDRQPEKLNIGQEIKEKQQAPRQGSNRWPEGSRPEIEAGHPYLVQMHKNGSDGESVSSGGTTNQRAKVVLIPPFWIWQFA